MKVLLKRNVPNLGKANEIKEVSEGYARNYLLPQGLAVPATKGMLRAAEQAALTQTEKVERQRAQAQQLATQLQQETLRLKAKAGETGRLYGSITSADIAQALSRLLKLDFDKRDVLLEHPLRDLGEHIINLKLSSGVRAQVRVVVVSEDE